MIQFAPVSVFKHLLMRNAFVFENLLYNGTKGVYSICRICIICRQKRRRLFFPAKGPKGLFGRSTADGGQWSVLDRGIHLFSGQSADVQRNRVLYHAEQVLDCTLVDAGLFFAGLLHEFWKLERCFPAGKHGCRQR